MNMIMNVLRFIKAHEAAIVVIVGILACTLWCILTSIATLWFLSGNGGE
jgi:hypothetical protein